MIDEEKETIQWLVSPRRGSELTSNVILARADAARVEWHYIAPCKPMQSPQSAA